MTDPTANFMRSVAIVPVESDGVSAMSPKRKSSTLCGFESVLVLEASSLLMKALESHELQSIGPFLNITDRRSLAGWVKKRTAEGVKVAPSLIHPLAVLSATGIAIAQSLPAQLDAKHTDADRLRVASAIATVALRLNASVTEGGEVNDENSLRFVARSSLWKAIENDDWMIWSADLIRNFEKTADYANINAAFNERTGLSIQQWFFRSIGAMAGRMTREAGSWGASEDVPVSFETAWLTFVSTPVEAAVKAARESLVSASKHGYWTVPDPFDLSWLATRPIVATNDGRYFPLWLSAMNRYLLPASVAQIVADTIGTTDVPYDHVVELLGRVAERILTEQVTALPSQTHQELVLEKDMPDSISRCDVLLESTNCLVGIDFTIASPTRGVSQGEADALDRLIRKFAGKFRQAYSTFTWRDPQHTKTRIPMLVLCTPTIIEPMFNEKVYDLLRVQGHARENEYLLTCHAPEFMDLIQYCSDHDIALADAINDWAFGYMRGAALDWWLRDRGALRKSGTARIQSLMADATATLSPAADQ